MILTLPPPSLYRMRPPRQGVRGVTSKTDLLLPFYRWSKEDEMRQQRSDANSAKVYSAFGLRL